MNLMSQLFAQVPLFAGLSKEQQLILEEIAAIKTYSAGETLFWEADPADAFYAVLAGEVKIVKLTSEGKEIILEMMVKGDFFGEMGIFEEKTRSATAVITRKSKLLVLERGDFIRFIKNNPELALKMIIELSHRLRQANQEIEGLAFSDAETRLKRLLLRLAGEVSAKGRTELVINRTITHQELAKFIGASRETVTRLINKMTASGLIESTGGKINVKNLARW